MIRRVIKIDEERCTGCGLCASACHEGAIGIRNGKAVLLREDYCDGLGDCLPSCPVAAIQFEEREAPAYNAAAVAAAKAKAPFPGCPGSSSQKIVHEQVDSISEGHAPDCLENFPIQLKLVSEYAPNLDNADLLIAADCTAYAYGNFHRDFIAGRVTLIGCPKLDEGDYTQKLTRILASHSIRSITVARMTVPCCGGLARAVQNAVAESGKFIPVQIVLFGPDGSVHRTNPELHESQSTQDP